MDNIVQHIGMPRRSGRYPWGSGEDPFQSNIDFRNHILELKKKGLSEVDIAKGEGMTTTQLRAKVSLGKTEERQTNINAAIRFKDKGMSNTEIAKRMNINESVVRSYLNPIAKERANLTNITANMLKENADKHRFIDVGSGIENHIGVNRTRVNTAIALLQEQGYKIHYLNLPQVGNPGQFTKMKILGAPNSEWKEIINDVSKIHSITARSDDYGRTFKTVLGLEPIQNVNSKRIHVRYGDEGGSDKDGVIELRRNVKDLNLGKNNYAQVRISVDGTHFLKGMAIYSDDMPSGADIIYNVKKKTTGNKLDAMKKLHDDPDNPFKATIRRQSGALNIINEEGSWDLWSKNISSQILSKQPVPLAKTQLGLILKQKKEEFDEIMALTNPAIKKRLLKSFADSCDSDAVHLKAAPLPRQASKVILPITKMKPNEVYAPTFRDGETVVLIRHPHGGRFEIPELKVNNKSKEAISILGKARDAIGINPIVARKLSGADFDGDTVIVIPNKKGLIKTAASLKNLQDFDPITSYPEVPGMKPMKPSTHQVKMGEVSNLITDMTIRGASLDKIARAVRHSMVVIDSDPKKRNLNVKQSYIDHGIASLVKEYQSGEGRAGGAATLISRAGATIHIPERRLRSAKEGGPIDPATGRLMYVETGRTYFDRDSKKFKPKLTKTERMSVISDARALSSGRPIEEVYASHANELKSFANRARKVFLETKPTKYNPSAKVAFRREVDSLDSKLRIALKNKPIEREAQILANSVLKRKKQENENMSLEEEKKIRNMALAEARVRTGAKKHLVDISDREWGAIQAGAISFNKLSQILDNSNLDRVKQLATPRTQTELTSTKIARAKILINNGATLAEVADRFNVSVNTLTNSLN